jgi:cell division protein FtsQ
VRRGPWIVAVTVVVVSVGIGVLHSPWLSLNTIEVVGASEAAVTDRIAATGIGEGAIMVWIDTDAIVEAVRADPWVADVRVQREFPDRLVVEVLEHRPTAWVEGSRGWMLVSSDGTVLEKASEPSDGLLRARIAARDVAVGGSSDERVWREVVALAQVLPPDVAAGEVGFRADELWMVVPDAEIRFGTPTDLADKGRVAAGILESGVPVGATIDVVAPRRPAVVPPPPSLVENPQPVVEGDTAEP